MNANQSKKEDAMRKNREFDEQPVDDKPLLERARFSDAEAEAAGLTPSELVDAGFRFDGRNWRAES
jgi:hypothetical protein